MRKILPAVCMLFIFVSARSQQLHFTSQYLQHNSMYNPAAAGIAGKDLLGLSYRSMWSSFPGNPRTFMVYGDFAVDKLNAGIGAYAYRDETGPTSRTGVQLAYSYHINSRSGKGKLGLGLELRALQYAIDRTKLSEALGNDPVLNGSDNKTGIDAGAGVYYTNGGLSVGAAVSQLIQSKLELADVPNSKQGGKLYRHYNVTASYKIKTDSDIYLLPNFMTRIIENSPSEYELGMLLNYQEKVWWAASWRFRQSWSLQAGFRLLQKVAITYSYDIYQSPISVYTSGSGAHEIGLQFDMKK